MKLIKKIYQTINKKMTDLKFTKFKTVISTSKMFKKRNQK